MNAPRVYVIDTSYLLEIFAVSDHSTKEARDEIRSRIAAAVENKARFYVTVPSIYELANHISHVSDGNKRRSLAERVRDDVLSSLDPNQSTPWTIIPSQQLDTFKKLIVSFVDEHVIQRIDLSDSTLIDEARRLKRDTYQRRGSPVHIWTKDEALKAYEPDTEPRCLFGVTEV